jgi:hypothetical protein
MARWRNKPAGQSTPQLEVEAPSALAWRRFPGPADPQSRRPRCAAHEKWTEALEEGESDRAGIRLEIPGFRPFTLITNILDETITARELALHYHKRWDIEIAYDEIKTHQCATLRGQAPTTFRSKRPDLVEQELYAMLIMYNLVRLLIRQAAEKHGKDPCAISFLDAVQHLIDAAPLMTAEETAQKSRFEYLLAVLADCEIDRPRRPCVSPRVVKVKVSKFKRKRDKHKSETRDLAKELKIIQPHPAMLGTEVQLA